MLSIAAGGFGLQNSEGVRGNIKEEPEILNQGEGGRTFFSGGVIQVEQRGVSVLAETEFFLAVQMDRVICSKNILELLE